MDARGVGLIRNAAVGVVPVEAIAGGLPDAGCAGCRTGIRRVAAAAAAYAIGGVALLPASLAESGRIGAAPAPSVQPHEGR